jgi:NAD(P)-dependent dehydrogenase (short-subunit alcohol dehydrogenase family)
MGRLDQKVAIITGAASGIGKACAARFAHEGARVVVADIQTEAGQSVAAGLADARFMHVDVRDAAAVEALIAATVQQLGRLDILINNAGIDGEHAPTAESSLENWRAVTAINLDGVYFGLKYALAAMVAQGQGGSIINIASVAGLVGVANLPAYNAAKGAVVQLTRAAAVEYAAQRIRVNALCPTAVLTPLSRQALDHSRDPQELRALMASVNPMLGMLVPDDVANAALFLASDEARFINGVALPIDGGYTAR